MLHKEEKSKIIKANSKSALDTGSYEVQVALLTADINKLQAHFDANPKDKFSFRGFIAKVNARKSLLKKLQEVDLQRYKNLIQKLNLRK